MEEKKIHNQKQNQHEESFDIGLIIFKIIKYWYLIVISVALALVIAQFVIKFQQPKYRVKATLLIKDEMNDLFLQTAQLNTKRNLKNEIGILSSFEMAEKTINNLDFYVSYFKQGRVRLTELYHNTPFLVNFDTNHLQLINTPIDVIILNENEISFSYEITEESKLYNYKTEQAINTKDNDHQMVTKQIKFNEPYIDKYFSFIVTANNDYSIRNFIQKNYKFQFNTIRSLIQDYKGVNISQTSSDASIIELSLISPTADKAIAYINKMCDIYLQTDLEKLNQKSKKTIQFIDYQLSELQDSIGIIQKELQNIRSDNLFDISAEAANASQKLEALKESKAQMVVQKRYYDYLETYLNKESGEITDIITPTAIGIQDQMLNTAVSEFNKLVFELQSSRSMTSPSNPKFKALEDRVLLAKNGLKEMLNNLKNINSIGINDIDKRITAIQNEINKFPFAEGLLKNVERDYSVNDQVYTYLKQKRAEAAITLASNTSNHRVIDYARFGQKVSPKANLILMGALTAGLLLPVLLILLLDKLNTKIINRGDIETATNVPIIGFIVHNTKQNDEIGVLNRPNSNVAESFRAIRTNLQYFHTDPDHKSIAITSTVSGEGKTFCSISLASIYALSGNKTVLLSSDLRKPKVFNIFEIENAKIGLSSYLIGKNTIDDIIFKSTSETLDIIPSGPVPPNPTELLERPAMKALMDELHKRYDYIIIDTSPVGLVADALNIMKLVDTTLFIIRQNYSNKSSVVMLNDIVTMTKQENIGIVINDVNVEKRGYGYGYGKYSYGYGYGYGYGTYYSDEKNKNRKKSIFRRIFG